MQKTDDKLVLLIVAEDEIHELQITGALTDAGIEYVVQSYFDQAYDGIFQQQKGFSRILVLERDLKRATEIISDSSSGVS